MKSLFLLLTFTTLTFFQEKVSLDDIANYEGKRITICENVTGTHQTKSKVK
jgi:hypothetical protein